MLKLLHSGDSITSRSHGVECSQPSVEVSDELCPSFSCTNSSSSVQVPGRTTHKSIQTSHSSCFQSQHAVIGVVQSKVGIEVVPTLSWMWFRHSSPFQHLGWWDSVLPSPPAFWMLEPGTPVGILDDGIWYTLPYWHFGWWDLVPLLISSSTFELMGSGSSVAIWDDGTQFHGIIWQMRFKAKLVDIGCINHFSSQYKQDDHIIAFYHIIIHLQSGLGAGTVNIVLLYIIGSRPLGFPLFSICQMFLISGLLWEVSSGMFS